MTPDLRLEVNGRSYLGWQEVEVSLGVDQLAGTFDLSVVDGIGTGARPAFVEGDRCAVKIGNETVITGFVDELLLDHDAKRTSTRVTGRDASADLVDCSVLPQQWQGRTITQIAADLCRPFGITVRALVDVGDVFAQFSAHPGEAVIEPLERMARHRGLLLMSDAQGGLLITRPSTKRLATELVRGRNILAGGCCRSQRDRFSRYTVLAQEPFNDDAEAEISAQPQGSAVDAAVLRHRPLVVLGEEDASTAALKRRATWERNTRAGRAQEAIITVQGWTHAQGIWRPDCLVPVRDSHLRIDGELYLAGVRFQLDDRRGSTTELRLLPASAYDVLAEPEAVAA